MNGRIRRMMREIERRGGTLYVNPQLPDDMAEQFLTEVLACPECTAGGRAADGRNDGHDPEPWGSVMDGKRGEGH